MRRALRVERYEVRSQKLATRYSLLVPNDPLFVNFRTIPSVICIFYVFKINSLNLACKLH